MPPGIVPEPVRKLRERGPSTMAGLDVGTTSISPDTRRRYDVRRVLIRSAVGKQTSVFYLGGEHDLEDVVRAYIEENPDILAINSGAISMMFGDHSAELAGAWRSISDEYDVEPSPAAGSTEDANPTYGECPLCGKEDIRRLPDHIPDCPEA